MRALILLLTLSPGSCLFWTETFESQGTDGNYSDGADVTPGNLLDVDAPVPPGFPPGWSTRAARVSVGTNVVDGAAHLRHVLATPTSDGFYTRVETILETPSVINGGATIMAAKPSGDPKGPVACWRLYYLTYQGKNYFWLSIGNFAKAFVYPRSGELELGRNYVHWVAYDLSRGLVGWSVNGETVFIDTIPDDYSQDIGTLILGSSGSSSSRGITYYIDNYAVVDAQ